MEDDAGLPPAPISPVDTEGKVAFGTYEGTTGPIDWFAGPHRPGRRRQWKLWHYLSVAGPEAVLAVAVVDLGWSGSAFAYLFDRTSSHLLADVSVVTAPGKVKVAGGPSYPATTSCASRKLFVRLTRSEAGFRLEARSTVLTVDVSLSEAQGPAPTLCAVAPVPGGVADCTHKTPVLHAEGLATAGGRSFDLSGYSGAVDHTSGLLARNTSWRWASASTADMAINLTEGFTAPAENALWHGSKLERLPPVTFTFDRSRPSSPWRIADDSGLVDLVFTPEGIRAKRINLVVAVSDYVQPIGTFDGEVNGMRVRAMAGVTEDHTSRW